MTKQEFRSQIKALITNSDILPMIEKVINSGCIDIESLEIDSDYIIKKAVVAAIFETAAINWIESKEGNKEKENIKLFL